LGCSRDFLHILRRLLLAVEDNQAAAATSTRQFWMTSARAYEIILNLLGIPGDDIAGESSCAGTIPAAAVVVPPLRFAVAYVSLLSRCTPANSGQRGEAGNNVVRDRAGGRGCRGFLPYRDSFPRRRGPRGRSESEMKRRLSVIADDRALAKRAKRSYLAPRERPDRKSDRADLVCPRGYPWRLAWPRLARLDLAPRSIAR